MCNAAAFENYNNHYFVHPVSEVLNLTKNFQQGAAQIVSEEGRGVMNLYLCAVCNTALCLACGTTGVTQNHFYGQVQFFVMVCSVHMVNFREEDQKMPRLVRWWGTAKDCGLR